MPGLLETGCSFAQCGVGPFARVASISELQRREEGGSESHAVVLDYNFDQITDLGCSLSIYRFSVC